MSASISSAFDTALRQQRTTKLSPADLLLQYPPPLPLTEAPLTKPLRECRYYEDFATAPEDANKKIKRAVEGAVAAHGEEVVESILQSDHHHELRRKRKYDFRLSQEEAARLEQNGFVVSERLGAESYAAIYYRLYSDDMPVYVTTDSVLHAWHRSFDSFLVELEEEELVPLVEKILDDVLAACDRLSSSPAASAVAQVQKEAKTFFSVAQHLLHGDLETDAADQTVTTILKAIEAEKLTTVDLFGSTRELDGSLFKPRGHYTKTKVLQRYFRAMTWLGTVDFRVDGTDDPASELHQLRIACLIVHLLRDSKTLEKVEAFHTIVSAITGDGYGSDSMTPLQLHNLLGQCDIASELLGEESCETKLRELQDEIANRGLGTQAIAGHPLTESAAAAASTSMPTRLPTSFAFMGQQFVWSAFVFSKLVYDQVIEHDEKIPRRMASAVDVAFALFGNNAASDVMAKRMQASPKLSDEFVEFRDGLPYVANAIAVRKVIDSQLAIVDRTTCSLALLWQLALRELSAASENQARVFASDAWKKRQMNTQIASLAQLRHDTILYAKQSLTMGTRCEYAAGFVDPYTAFWTKMQLLAQRAGEIVDQVKCLDLSGDGEESMLQYKARVFFDNFADVMRKLHGISVAQAMKQTLDEEQDDFLKTVIEERRGSGATRYLGWYPSLFYTHREDSGKRDHVVADIHTDVPSVEHGDPGGILHLGVGNVNLGFFVIDSVMYAGPVFSHYEFVTPIDERLTDDEFSARLGELQAPSWARQAFLVTNNQSS